MLCAEARRGGGAEQTSSCILARLRKDEHKIETNEASETAKFNGYMRSGVFSRDKQDRNAEPLQWSGRRESNPYSQLGKLTIPRSIYNNLQNCSAKGTLHSLQSLLLFPILHPLVGHWWDKKSAQHQAVFHPGGAPIESSRSFWWH